MPSCGRQPMGGQRQTCCVDKPVEVWFGFRGVVGTFVFLVICTAVAHNINVVVVVFNDNAYGNVKRDQMNQFNGRTIGADLHNPDFVKLAEAYGARGFLANGPAELEATLKKALTLDAPVLIEVPVGPMPSPFFKAP